MKAVLPPQQPHAALNEPLLASSASGAQELAAASRSHRETSDADDCATVTARGSSPARRSVDRSVPGSVAPVLTKPYLNAWAQSGGTKAENRQRQAAAKKIMPGFFGALFEQDDVTLRNYPLITHLPQGLDCKKGSLHLEYLASLRDIGPYTQATCLYVVGCPQLQHIEAQQPHIVNIKRCDNLLSIASGSSSLWITSCRSLQELNLTSATKVLALDALPQLERLPDNLTLNRLRLSSLLNLRGLPLDLKVTSLEVEAKLAKRLDLSRFPKVTLIDIYGNPCGASSADGTPQTSTAYASEASYAYTSLASC